MFFPNQKLYPASIPERQKCSCLQITKVTNPNSVESKVITDPNVFFSSHFHTRIVLWPF